MSDSRTRKLIEQYEERATLLGAAIGLGLALYTGPAPVGDWMQSHWSWLKLALLASFIGALLGMLFFRLLVLTQIIRPPCPASTTPDPSPDTRDGDGVGYCDAGD